MRWHRALKRLLLALTFLCMTIKIQLELRMLDSTKTDAVFSPWWSNETLGHLRPFSKASSSLLDHSRASTHPHSKHLVSMKILANLSSKNTIPIADNVTGGRDNFVNNGTNRNETVMYNKLTKPRPAGVTAAMSENKPIKILRQEKDSLVHKNVSRKNIASVIAKRVLPLVEEFVRNSAKESVTQGTELKRTKQNPETITSTKKDVFAKLDMWDNNKDVKLDIVNTDFTEVKTKPRALVISAGTVSKTKDGNQKSQPAQKRVIPVGHVRGRAAVRAIQKVSPKRGVSHDVDTTEVSLRREDIVKIKAQLKIENDQQKVHNLDRYGPVQRNTSILLVQVHNRLENLRYLVESMKEVRGIQEALVVFSHDLWDPAMNSFVRNITDFRVMQIFFPFSIQLHPFSFPGRDPRDCTWNTARNGRAKCLNHRWPDSYGHYREASFTQIKHHWWWKIHRVFEGLEVTRTNYTGHVVFLEEDHYVTPDLLHVLGLLRANRRIFCPSCQVLALGNYNKMSVTVYKNFVEKGDWWVTKHNLGFALDAAAWKVLSKCKDFFCHFDDYNWDWTMNHAVQMCLNPRMSMLSVRLTRVIHVGSCGTHVKKRTCDVRKEVQQAVTRIKTAKQYLFPQSLTLQSVYRGSGKAKRGNGGWGDLRDHVLCLAIGNGTASQHTIDRLQYPESL